MVFQGFSYPSSGDLRILGFFSLVPPLYLLLLGILCEMLCHLASKQREGGGLQIYQEILGAKPGSRCIISTYIKTSALWLVQATVQGRLGNVVSFYLESKSRIDECLSVIVSIFTNERTNCNFSHVHILKNETDLGLLPWKSGSWSSYLIFECSSTPDHVLKLTYLNRVLNLVEANFFTTTLTSWQFPEWFI